MRCEISRSKFRSETLSDSSSMARVLILAYHFPPCSGSSGLLRSLKFCRYLPSFGWHPVVLTLHPRAYESTDAKSVQSIPKEVPVIRSFALDTKRHLGFKGFYLRTLALPDRWISWLLSALPAGLWAIKKHRVDVIFSTFPFTTPVLAGLLLRRLTGIPWVLDLRDSMTEDNYPPNPRERRVRRWIEKHAVHSASYILFTADSTRRMYLERYPELSPERCLVISNGYDEEDFAFLGSGKQSSSPSVPMRLLHAGLLYPEERDPKPFFGALRRLKRDGQISPATLQMTFRAPGSEQLYTKLLQEFEIADLVQLCPHIPYQQALQECADSDALLLFQAANCDHQIPAKAYEYLRLRRPILALTSHSGDTAKLLQEVGGATIVDLSDEEQIYRALPVFLDAVRRGAHALADPLKLQRYTRKSQAQQLATCLDRLVAPQSHSIAEKTEEFVG
jgi:glycosyltransferase involved in cell wall biosynthesis